MARLVVTDYGLEELKSMLDQDKAKKTHQRLLGEAAMKNANLVWNLSNKANPKPRQKKKLGAGNPNGQRRLSAQALPQIDPQAAETGDDTNLQTTGANNEPQLIDRAEFKDLKLFIAPPSPHEDASPDLSIQDQTPNSIAPDQRRKKFSILKVHSKEGVPLNKTPRQHVEREQQSKKMDKTERTYLSNVIINWKNDKKNTSPSKTLSNFAFKPTSMTRKPLFGRRPSRCQSIYQIPIPDLSPKEKEKEKPKPQVATEVPLKIETRFKDFIAKHNNAETNFIKHRCDKSLKKLDTFNRIVKSNKSLHSFFKFFKSGCADASDLKNKHSDLCVVKFNDFEFEKCGIEKAELHKTIRSQFVPIQMDLNRINHTVTVFHQREKLFKPFNLSTYDRKTRSLDITRSLIPPSIQHLNNKIVDVEKDLTEYRASKKSIMKEIQRDMRSTARKKMHGTGILQLRIHPKIPSDPIGNQHLNELRRARLHRSMKLFENEEVQDGQHQESQFPAN